MLLGQFGPFKVYIQSSVLINSSLYRHHRQDSVGSTASSDSGSAVANTYFDYYSRDILVDALKAFMRQSLRYERYSPKFSLITGFFYIGRSSSLI